MKKTKKYIENNKKPILAFILGLIISGTGVYAATILYNSNQVGYDNTSSGFVSTNVQDAIDELYIKAYSWVYPNDMGTPQYYAFGKYKGLCPSTDSECNSFAQFPTTSTIPPSGKNVYAAKYADGGYGVCIKRNGSEHCFRCRNWTAEKEHIQKVLSECYFYTDRVDCYTSDFYCSVTSSGTMLCNDRTTNEFCRVNSSGYVSCNW